MVFKIFWPKVSVVMSTYNRAEMLPNAIESILNQTFTNFEFIIIDDASTDSTFEILQYYKKKDRRIRIYRNKQNCGCTSSYIKAQKLLSKSSKYMAHIDDDDISFPNRLEIQYKYMQGHKNVAACGSFIEVFGTKKAKSWVTASDYRMLNLLLNFYNPFCHSSMFFRKSFLQKNKISYTKEALCAQDYKLYSDIVMANGKIINIPIPLVKYRMHSHQITHIKHTQNIQIIVAKSVKGKLLSRFFSNHELATVLEKLHDFPFNNYDVDSICRIVECIKHSSVVKVNKEQIKKLHAILQKVKNDGREFLDDELWDNRYSKSNDKLCKTSNILPKIKMGFWQFISYTTFAVGSSVILA